jgi:hypothetical protein
MTIKNISGVWECSSLEELMLSLQEALGCIPSTAKQANKHLSQTSKCMPVVPATQKVEARGSPETRHSGDSLGNIGRNCLKIFFLKNPKTRTPHDQSTQKKSCCFMSSLRVSETRPHQGSIFETFPQGGDWRYPSPWQSCTLSA